MTKLNRSEKYDYGTITLRAVPGKLIDLDKLHESVWATRLSGGTRSGLVKLEITVVGQAVQQQDNWMIQVNGSPEYFLLGPDPESEPKDGSSSAFKRLQTAVSQGEKVKGVTGRLDGWSGRWPTLLAQKPPKPRRIFVTEFQVQGHDESK